MLILLYYLRRQWTFLNVIFVWVDEELAIVFFKLIKQNKWTERYLYGIICSVQCVNIFSICSYNKITTKRIQKSSNWEESHCFKRLVYCKLTSSFFTSYCYKHILTVFSILKRRHILFLSPYSALSKIKCIIYNPVKKTHKKLFRKEYTGKADNIWTRIKY